MRVNLNNDAENKPLNVGSEEETVETVDEEPSNDDAPSDTQPLTVKCLTCGKTNLSGSFRHSYFLSLFHQNHFNQYLNWVMGDTTNSHRIDIISIFSSCKHYKSSLISVDSRPIRLLEGWNVYRHLSKINTLHKDRLILPTISLFLSILVTYHSFVEKVGYATHILHFLVANALLTTIYYFVMKVSKYILPMLLDASLGAFQKYKLKLVYKSSIILFLILRQSVELVRKLSLIFLLVQIFPAFIKQYNRRIICLINFRSYTENSEITLG